MLSFEAKYCSSSSVAVSSLISSATKPSCTPSSSSFTRSSAGKPSFTSSSSSSAAPFLPSDFLLQQTTFFCFRFFLSFFCVICSFFFSILCNFFHFFFFCSFFHFFKDATSFTSSSFAASFTSSRMQLLSLLLLQLLSLLLLRPFFLLLPLRHFLVHSLVLLRLELLQHSCDLRSASGEWFSTLQCSCCP